MDAGGVLVICTLTDEGSVLPVPMANHFASVISEPIKYLADAILESK